MPHAAATMGIVVLIRVVLSLSVMLVACASPSVRPAASSAAPNPNGCHVFAFERPAFTGERLVINGPGRFSSLNTIGVDASDWDRRIRSARVGNTASLTVYTERNLSGRSATFVPGSTVAQFEPALTDRIRSLLLECGSSRP